MSRTCVNRRTHIKMRMEERFGIKIGLKEIITIKNKCRENKLPIVAIGTIFPIIVYWKFIQGKIVYIIYNTKIKYPVTVYTAKMISRLFKRNVIQFVEK